MSDKRRGLGRGLGALIPNTPPPTRPAGERPVDVFFPGRGDSTGLDTVVVDVPGADPARAGGSSLDESVEGSGTGGSGSAGVRTEGSGSQGAGAEASTRGSGTAEAQHTEGGRPDGAGAGGDPSPLANVPTSDSPSGAPTGGADLVPVPGARFAEVPVGAIRPNPRQPRQVFDEEDLTELVHSIREIGVLQPVVVRPVAPEDGEPRYELVMGERRWRATQEAGLAAIPAIVRDTADDDLLRDALLENLHRSDLNALEEAAAYQQLLDDFGCTHEQLAARIGRSRPQISNTLRLLKLPPLVQRRVAAGVLSAGHARALLGLEDAAGMERLAQRIVSEGLSVRAVEEVVALGDGPVPRQAKRRPRAGGKTPELDDLAARLGDKLDTRVSVALGRSKGKLSIDFASVEDLNRIIGLLTPDLRKPFSRD